MKSGNLLHKRVLDGFQSDTTVSLQFEKDMVHEMFTSFLQVMHIFLSEKKMRILRHIKSSFKFMVEQIYVTDTFVIKPSHKKCKLNNCTFPLNHECMQLFLTTVHGAIMNSSLS